MKWTKISLAKRKEEMERLAFELDMEYIGDEEWGMLNRLKGFNLFKRGGRKKIFNLMQRKGPFLDEQIAIFDYFFIISTGKTTKKFYTTVFFIQAKSLGLPEFMMKPENFFHKIGSFFGMQDIDFEEHPEFSNKYLLKSEDEERMRDVFHDDVLRFFTVEKNWTVEGVGYFLTLYQYDKLLSERHIKDFYKKGMQLYEYLRDK
jgi:hypothetical protein